jgi:hydrogenase nickel incorporation protein HypA/HybF
MHEWALAESIITTAVETAENKKLKIISEIKIRVGELQQIEQDILEFALGEIIKSQNGKLKNVKTVIETEESNLKCKNCGNKWKFKDMKEKLSDDDSESIHFIPEVTFVHTRCPKCSSPDFEIITGRGISITSIKGKR